MNCAGVIVFNNLNQTIIVKTNKENCSFPKGKKKKKETNFNAAIRELYEETGIDKHSIKFLKNVTFSENTILYYVAIYTETKQHTFKYDSKELASVEWYDITSIPKLKMKTERKKIINDAYEIIVKKNYELIDYDEIEKIENKPKDILISKTLYWILKYKPKELNINTDKDNLVNLDDLLKLDKFKFISISDLQSIIKNDKRFSLIEKDSKFYVRINEENNNNDVLISKTLSKILRHRAKELKINLNDDGYAKLDDLLKLQQLNNVTVSDIERVVKNNDKQRFTLIEKDSKYYIRANQGHSKDVASDINDKKLLTKIDQPYKQCFHGTSRKLLGSIRKTGLNSGKRKHIHLTDNYDYLRNNCSALIHIDMEAAMKDGMIFYISDNKVILTEGINGVIDSKYFSKIENFKKKNK
jgi:RNA:NAD 2''-phosphotransferase